MQVTAAPPLREHEKPMSWARAVLIATGFFFITAILAAQLPSYIFFVATSSNLQLFEQGTLDLGLLAFGVGLLCLEISFLYDPRPLIPWVLFALAGMGIAAVGAFTLYQVSVGPGGTSLLGQPGWPAIFPQSGYLIHPAWFQAGSIAPGGLGLIALSIGLLMTSLAVLNPLVLSGRLLGPARDLIVRFGLGLAFVIVALYLTIYTFNPEAFGPRDKHGTPQPGGLGNVLLFLALGAALIATLVWLLPVMTASRQRFMPAVYLHGVVGLIGFVAVPLLLVWVLTYPVVNLIHGVDDQQFWVQCSQKTVIPGSCTFSPFTGYIICALVFNLTFGLLIAGLYFWSSRRDTIVLGGTIGLIYLALAATVIHVTQPDQTPMGLIIATGIILVAYFWTWGTQREFAPTRAEPLGCTGQWLVLGTLLLIYLFGFAVFSLPNFFETEALALFYNPGHNQLHDAFWGMLLMGGLVLLQMTLLIRRRPMSSLRKFALWVMLGAVVLMVIGSIQGFHRNLLDDGLFQMESSHAVFLTGIVSGLAACLYDAFQMRSTRWLIAIAAVALVGVAISAVTYTFSPPYPELVEAGFIIALAGAFAYTAAGPSEEGEAATYGAARGGNGYAIPR